ncbi:Cyclic nucleotide-binding domain-containing protein [Penicillium ucsense]|uniref:Cyclic nucleotide-binding domain-containing protein n=1 Tax=Penicillium ucsense TaxID=2839758 RepID=A0A8J8W0D1_9EURO|nr:Cyclic nucleotide-binding domain-containing protein [Penicillium ucsense]KAF7735894.1 Cyclic nucleotide-binding domain-containing protein [Penicillium ucsense]
MRRHGRSSGGPTKAVSPLSDTVSLIHSFDSVLNPNRPARPSPLASSHIKALPLELVDRLRSFPLFQATPESFLIEVGQHLRPQLHAPNDYILTEGDDARAIYWLVRGAVSVTSRDGESIYAELKPGAFFGEIGVLMDRPRTATIIARTRCMLVVLTKEDFRNILPRFPDVERAIREEAQERLTILEKKKQETSAPALDKPSASPVRRGSKRLRESNSRDLTTAEEDVNSSFIHKKRKSPSPGRWDPSSALANGLVNVRLLLKELPLFKELPADILHFLGLNAQPSSYPPFTDIIKQDSQGRELFFIVRGEVEVVTERRGQSMSNGRHEVEIKARLRQGQYFGEVVSLSLAPRRTATVRSVTSVECLMISGDVLEKFWDMCPHEVREQVERTAQERLSAAADGDVIMTDASEEQSPMGELPVNERVRVTATRRRSMPLLTLTETELDGPHQSSSSEDQEQAVLRPSDPDPYLSLGLDKVRLRSRRGSLAPLTPEEISGDEKPVQPNASHAAGSSSDLALPSAHSLSKPQHKPHLVDDAAHGVFPDSILLRIFEYMELHELIRLRGVSSHWSEILNTSDKIVQDLDLSIYNRCITDDVLVKVICPFVGSRPRSVNINNCFHITDEGFNALVKTCAPNSVVWRMKSVWDVTASAILEMSSKAVDLEEVELSNCRKVGDTLMARIIGWAVPHSKNDSKTSSIKPTLQTAEAAVYGCPKLKKLTLSYCKHVTDRSMHHIASHAAKRIEEMDLTRCTTITDQGFQYWGNTRFTKLRRLCLADCTYLTDNAIVHLTNAAKQLQELDLSFCCALSDTATEVLALQCSQLQYLNMSFCGSAISDPSLRSIGLHLLSLKHLSVRGCVRVTGVGVEAVAEGCHQLQTFDVSQCKNLTPWLEDNGPMRYQPRIEFDFVAPNGKKSR